MRTTSSERSLGDEWAEVLRASGCWVQKLPATSMAGLPDWLVGRLGAVGGVKARFVEAKTLAAVLGAKGKTPRAACSTAQQFFLDRWVQSGGRGSVLVLDESGWIEIDWRDAHRRLTAELFDAGKWNWSE